MQKKNRELLPHIKVALQVSCQQCPKSLLDRGQPEPWGPEYVIETATGPVVYHPYIIQPLGYRKIMCATCNHPWAHVPSLPNLHHFGSHQLM
jgi:hypothetical protein